WVVKPTRFGLAALSVEQGNRHALLLPQAAMTSDLDPRGFVDALIDKAGITRPPYRWSRWSCTTWLIGPNGIQRLKDGLPERAKKPAISCALLDGYLMQHHTKK